MDLYKLIGYPLIAVAILDGVLGFLLLKKNPRDRKVNKAAAALGFASALYALFAGIVYIRSSMGLDFDTFYRACWIGWFAVPAALQCVYYLEDEKSRYPRIIGLILYPFWGIIYLLCLFSNFIERGAFSLIPFVDNFGPLERPFRLLGGIFFLWIIYKFFRLRKNVSGTKKIQLNYFILATIIFAVVAVIINNSFQLFVGFSIDPILASYASLPWLALTFYAITRYRLFDIQLIISRAIAITVLAVIVEGLGIVLFKFLAPLIGFTMAFLTSLLAVAAIFLNAPLTQRVQNSISGLFLKDKYNYQGILKESTKAIITILDQNDLLNYLIDAMQAGFKINKACLFLKGEGDYYYMRYERGIDKKTAVTCKINDSLLEWLKSKKQIFIKEEQEEATSQKKFDALYGNMGIAGAELIIPLFFKDQMIALLTLGSKGNKEPYMQSDIDILETLANQAAIAIENSRLYDEAIKDSLTGLYHHKYFMERLQEEMERFKRYRHDMSLLMIDIDHFKKINDTFGHPVGDRVLREVSTLLKQISRKVDIVARYGGEEFVILLPDTKKKGALIMAERLRKSVEEMPLGDNLKVTVSIGISCCDEREKELSQGEFIEHADNALYRAKENGRNRVETVDV